MHTMTARIKSWEAGLWKLLPLGKGCRYSDRGVEEVFGTSQQKLTWSSCFRSHPMPRQGLKQVFSLLILLLVLPKVNNHFMTRDLMTNGTGPLNVTLSGDVENQSGRVQIAVVKACVGSAFKRISNASLENGLNYAKIHSYDFLEVNEGTFPEVTFVTPHAWVKIAYLHDLLVSRLKLDWVFWLDCDTLVLRPQVSVESVLQEMNVGVSHDLVFTEDDPNHRAMAPFNSGVFFIRNSRWAVEELSRVLRLASQQEIRNHGLWEQEALRRLYISNDNAEHAKMLIVPERWKFNAFDRLEEETNETFIWHRTACRDQPKCDDKYLFRASQVQF